MKQENSKNFIINSKFLSLPIGETYPLLISCFPNVFFSLFCLIFFLTIEQNIQIIRTNKNIRMRNKRRQHKEKDYL